MSLELLFITAFVVGLTGAMAPGPLLTLTVAEVAKRGFWAAPLLMVGHAVLEGALIIALTLGLATYLIMNEVMGAIALLGGIFLLWMGYTIARDALKNRISLSSTQEAATTDRTTRVPMGAPRLMGLGILTSVSNPYWSLWWATIGLGYITLSLEQGSVGLAAFFTGHILADFFWYGLIAAAIVGGRRFFTPAIYRGVLTVCGVFLVGLGGYFINSGIVRFGLI
ncbi:MAG: LysE family transporter [Eubacteriales bacterium]|jgi:threonine/homoserine/homoserine lactone efflux protein|nr:LysE family translocator [Bacillota bacterium]MBV1769167.1 LysE family translocator [Desulforudis sp.]MDQ7789852.1 LysE family transporter [Clostridia bacterium]MDZ4043391.1 LysE family transporter [Eubacteriales bacterium]MDP3045690.1 LysE family transporter [Bacillota bacterium]